MDHQPDGKTLGIPANSLPVILGAGSNLKEKKSQVSSAQIPETGSGLRTQVEQAGLRQKFCPPSHKAALHVVL